MKRSTPILSPFLRAFALLLIAVPAFAQQPQLTDRLPVAANIRTGKLPNGLTYYIRKNGKPEQKVELRLAVNTGSILEDDSQQGLAHFTEHMGFNGTRHFKKNELVSFLQDIGVKFGADLNAHTSFDETIYILPIPVDKKENLEKGFTVLEDWAGGVAFEDSEIDKERGVVLEESRLGKGANDRINKVVFPKMFENSKYATRLPIGKDEILKTFKYEEIRRFYKDWYRPDLMAVVVVGDVDPDEAERLIKSHFSNLSNPSRERERVLSPISPRQKSEAIILSDKESTNSILRIYYSLVKSKDVLTVGDYREEIIKTMFQIMLGSRLQELTQKPAPPFVYGGISVSGFVREYEGFSSFAVIGQGGAEPAILALAEESERARKFGFTAAELDRSKKMILKSYERAFNERDKTESDQFADELVRHFLSREPVTGIEKELELQKLFLDGLQVEEVNNYAAKTIPTSGSKLVVLTTPEKVDFTVPTPDQLLASIDAASKVEVKPYEEAEVAKSLLAALPTPGKVVSTRNIKEGDYSEVKLSNGLTVVLKPTNFKNDQVMMSGFRFGGQFLYGVEDRYNAEYAAQIIMQMGVASFTPVDLRKVLAGKQAGVAPRINQLSEGIAGQSSAADVETMLQLTYLYFTQPRRDDDLFKSFISKQQALYENQLSDPQTVFQDSVLRIVYGNHPRAPQVPRPATFARIDEQRTLAIYKERFSNAAGYTFIIVGSFDTNTILPLIATYLGSLPASGTPPTYKDAGVRPAKGVIRKEVRKGTEQKSFISMRFTGETPYSDADQFRLQALLETMNIKLIEKLREELSGIYGGSVSGTLSKFPYQNYSISVSLPCGPENVDKLIKATLDEIEKVKANGPTEEDLTKVKTNWKKDHEESLKDNGYWLHQLQTGIETKSGLDNLLNYTKNVDALTTNDLKAAAVKYFDMKNFIQVVLFPE